MNAILTFCLTATAATAAPPDLPILPPPEKAKPDRPPLPPPVREDLPKPIPVPPAGPVEVAPPPRIPLPPFTLTPVKGGYQVALNRRTAELLRGALDKADEKELAATLRKMAADKKASGSDEQTVATLELIALVAQTQLPGFKKAMNEGMGPNGVVITLTGLQSPTVQFRKPRPILQKGVQIVRGVMPLLPEEARETIEGLRAMARTTPLFWKVEPRE